MNVSMFSSWQVRCGIADYSAQLVSALNQLPNLAVRVVPFDRQVHPRKDYESWGEQMNGADVAHVQHEYTFFGYLLPWRNQFGPFTRRIQSPLVITKHVSIDGPLTVRGTGIKHIIWQTKWALYNRWLGSYARYLNKDTFDIARQIIVLSSRLKDQLIARGIRSDKVHVIPAGVDEARPVPPGAVEQLRDQWGWRGKRIIGHFGYIAPPKGHTLGLEALARLPEDYVYLIAGGVRLDSQHSYLNALEQRALELGVAHRLRITGFLPANAVAAHIAACDVLVYPNTHADFSYSVITGLAQQSAPVIASNVLGHREIQSYAHALDLFQSGDAADLAHHILQVTTQENRQRELRVAAAQFAKDYTWSQIARRTAEVYQFALG